MGWVVSITPRPRFTPGERTPGTHCTGGWVGPRAGLDTEARGKILCPRRGPNPDRPVVQPVVRQSTPNYNVFYMSVSTVSKRLLLGNEQTRKWVDCTWQADPLTHMQVAALRRPPGGYKRAERASRCSQST